MSRRLPVIDMAPLFGDEPGSRMRVAGEIAAACRAEGFFYVTGHGVAADVLGALEAESRRFFDLPAEAKMRIAMSRGGRAWRGYFPVGGELTSGRPDLKEGLYLGTELAPDHPRVRAGLPMHGANLWPDEVPGLRAAAGAYMAAATRAGAALMEGISLSLGLPTISRRPTRESPRCSSASSTIPPPGGPRRTGRSRGASASTPTTAS